MFWVAVRLPVRHPLFSEPSQIYQRVKMVPRT